MEGGVESLGESELVEYEAFPGAMDSFHERIGSLTTERSNEFSRGTQITLLRDFSQQHRTGTISLPSLIIMSCFCGFECLGIRVLLTKMQLEACSLVVVWVISFFVIRTVKSE